MKKLIREKLRSIIMESNVPNEFDIEVDLVPYTFKLVDNMYPTYSVENFKGLEGYKYLDDGSGDFNKYFGVNVYEDDNTIEIVLYDPIVEMYDNNIEDSLLDAISVIDRYYDDVGWEFLS